MNVYYYQPLSSQRRDKKTTTTKDNDDENSMVRDFGDDDGIKMKEIDKSTSLRVT